VSNRQIYTKELILIISVLSVLNWSSNAYFNMKTIIYILLSFVTMAFAGNLPALNLGNFTTRKLSGDLSVLNVGSFTTRELSGNLSEYSSLKPRTRPSRRSIRI